MYTETDASLMCIPLAGMPFHRRLWHATSSRGGEKLVRTTADKNFCKDFSRKLTCNLKTMSYDFKSYIFSNSGSAIAVLSLKL